jgi:hypothetical protein
MGRPTAAKCSCVQRLRVRYAANIAPVSVDEKMSGRVRWRFQPSIADIPFNVNHNHVPQGQTIMADPTRLDDNQPGAGVSRADVPDVKATSLLFGSSGPSR